MFSKKLFVVFFLIFTCNIIFAHPHLYIDMHIELDIDDYGLKGFWQDWTILKNFGEKIGIEYDQNGDGFFDQLEISQIENEVFRNIQKYNYFTRITIEGKEYLPLGVTDFQAEKLEGKTRYRFYVPCRINAVTRKKDFTIIIYDESLYVSFGLMQIIDPYNSNIDYSIYIAHDSNMYSHSNNLGNSVIEIFMGLSDEGITEESPAPIEPVNLVFLDRDNREIIVSTGNPFTSFGINVGDGSGNPFFKE